MDMKRFLTVMAALLVASTAMFAQTVEKTIDIDDFTGIRASDAFDVTLIQSKDYEVIVEVTEDFLPYLEVKNKKGVLELGFGKLPFKLKQKERKRVAKATISMPTLTYIELSGSSKLTSDDQFSNTMHKFSIEMRGASNIEFLELKTPDVDIELDGGSKATLKLRSSDVKADLAGASKLKVTGETTDLEVKAKSASRFDGERFETREAVIEASGASSVDVFPTRKLSVNLTGASKCRYYGDEDKLSVKAEKVTGASSLKHHR